MNKTEPDPSQRCTVKRQEATVTSYNKGNSNCTEGRNSSQWEWLSTATGAHRGCRSSF